MQTWEIKAENEMLCLTPYSAAAAAAKSLQSCPTLCDPIDGSPPGSPAPGVGCHILLQCMKVKSESEFAQSCPTLSDPMDCSLPGSSIHGIFQARVLEWGATAFSTKAGDSGSTPRSGRSPREGNGNPLQYSCLENPKDRGA